MGGPGSGPRKGQKRKSRYKTFAEAAGYDIEQQEYVLPVWTPPVTEDDLDVIFTPGPKGGRPAEMTVTKVQAILDAIVQVMPAKQAAIEAGIGERTFFRWMETYPKFADLVARARAIRMGRIGRQVLKQVDDNWAAGITLLERLEPQDFGRKDRVEHVGQLEVGINVTQVLLNPAAIAKASELEGLLQNAQLIEGEARELPVLPEHVTDDDEAGS